MEQTERLEQFAQEYPFPWSIAPSPAKDDPCGRLEAKTTRALVNFETFVERFREQLTLREESGPAVASPRLR